MSSTNPETSPSVIQSDPVMLVASEPAASSPMSLLATAVDRGMSPDQLRQLMELQERWDKNRAAEAFAEAVTEFQRRCPPIKKSRQADAFGGGKGYTYASLDDIMREITPHLSATGLCVSFDVEHVESSSALHIVTCIRKGIHEQRTRFACPVPDMKVNATQRYGAALSYAKRYALCAALNLTVTNEDADGKGLGETVETISGEEAIVMEEMIEASKADRAKFLAWCQVKDIHDMPRSFYRTAMDTLKKKMERK